MSTTQRQKTRLGDLLVERGLITQEQLLSAIQEQKTSQLQLGEILVAHGWVSRRQIRKVLRVQSKLRNAILTSILSFSPLVMVGCGGGSQSQVGGDETVAEQTFATSQGKQQPSEPDKTGNTDNTTNTDNTVSTSSTGNTVSTGNTLDTGNTVNTSTTVNTNNTVMADNGATIHLSWDYPAERVDGSELEVYEIESFRVYQMDENGDVGAVHIVDGLETEYDVAGLGDGEYHFAVTVVDSDGMESDYSEIVTVSVL